MNNKNESSPPTEVPKTLPNPSQTIPAGSPRPTVAPVRVSTRLEAKKAQKEAATENTPEPDNNIVAMAKQLPKKVTLGAAMAAYAMHTKTKLPPAPKLAPAIRKEPEQQQQDLRGLFGPLAIFQNGDAPWKKQKFFANSEPRLPPAATSPPDLNFGATAMPQPNVNTDFEAFRQQVADQLARLTAENVSLRQELDQLRSLMTMSALPQALTTDQKNPKNKKTKKIQKPEHNQPTAPKRTPPQVPVPQPTWATVASKKKADRTPHPPHQIPTNTTTAPNNKPIRIRPSKAQAIRALQESAAPSKYTYSMCI
ncbi:hypothetical protein BCR43DRAFT_509883 [Syncephalastrum racemosum]|uniref:Uncharacterized protein n=1 Tax=Syncephalastrum racemosum TaxID=13706 RepID=A0A1X2HT64_SYNRA|nr:hypothetical protein BCR43DRAFT_509883 [Syncephalastrum racemosum]